MLRKGLIAIAAASMMAGTALAPVEQAQAQIPAFLPKKDAVPAGEPLEIDGDWRISTIGKAIRIDRGRAYALEPWIHAFVLKVQPDMVVIRNISQTADDEFKGDDLPLMGKATMRLVSHDRIDVTVPGLLGPVRYSLLRVGEAAPYRDDNPPTFVAADNSANALREQTARNAPPPKLNYASLAEAFGEPRKLDETFRGCAIPKSAGENAGKDTPPPAPRDRITDRTFAPVAGDDENGTKADEGDPCWTRLDGVWTENKEPLFDTSRNNGRAWDVQGSPLAGLLHGNYTTPETIFIVPGDDPESELWVMSGTGDVRFTRFVSNDGVAVADLVGSTGVAKVYEAEGRSSLGNRLTIDYTAGDVLRIRVSRRQFMRPLIEAESDLSINNAFVIQYQTDSFAANLKGYDVLTQDPFLLMDNNKGEVFARRGQDEYRIQEKYAVPFGFTLKNELLQGNVYRRTIVSSEKEIQESLSSGFGWNANVSVSGAVNSVLAFVPGAGQVADTGFSVGNSSTRATMNMMRDSQSVARVVGYSRAKSYALVVDHANIKLSSAFLTAVGDAQNEGRYRELIERFGTHYAYAVTYGASAKMTQDISEEAFASALGENEGNRFETELKEVGSSIGGFNESMHGSLHGTSGQIGNEGGRFVAVGGNGSWDQSGYSRGDRVAPILLDLRPLDELLNPINFPDQPDVYTRVRTELALAINHYLAGQARPLSNERLISKVSYVRPAPPLPDEPAAEPEPIEEWLVYVRQIGCTKPGPGVTSAVEGTIQITGKGYRNAFAQAKTLTTGCKWREELKRKYDYDRSSNSEGLMILRGTREQMKKYKLKFDFNWSYKPGIKYRMDSRSLNNTPMQGSGLGINTSHTTVWTVGPKGRPEIKLWLRVKRVAPSN